MKIERISEKQIKCTLSRSDLIDHQLKISELAYGTENAKELFRDMMDEAFDKFGFDANNIPLMIEAVPVSPDCIVLLITKVDNPDELNNKFSKFSPSASEPTDQKNSDDPFDDLNGLFPMVDAFEDIEELPPLPNKKIQNNINLSIYDFTSLDSIIAACKCLTKYNIEDSSLYKTSDNIYYLVFHYSSDNRQYERAISTTLLEFGHECANAHSIEAFLKEHGDTLVAGNAVNQLSLA